MRSFPNQPKSIQKVITSTSWPGTRMSQSQTRLVCVPNPDFVSGTLQFAGGTIKVTYLDRLKNCAVSQTHKDTSFNKMARSRIRPSQTNHCLPLHSTWNTVVCIRVPRRSTAGGATFSHRALTETTACRVEWSGVEGSRSAKRGLTPTSWLICASAISRGMDWDRRSLAWPPKPLDFTSLNFLSWVYTKHIMYQKQVRDEADLHRWIIVACEPNTPAVLQNAWQEVDYCLDIYFATNCAHVGICQRTMEAH
jgi:hypothetical protein